MGALADALAGSGQYVKWDDLGVGAEVSGTVTGVQMRQARKFQSTDLDYWDDGAPKMQAVVTINSPALRDPRDPDDDGTRNITINLWSGQKKALGDACRVAGVKEPTPGDTFAAKWVSGVGRAGDPREYAYRVTPGGAGVGDVLAAQPQTPAAGPWDEQIPAGAFNPPPAAAAPSKPDQVKQLAAAGLDNTQIAAATGYTPEQVAALRNL